MTLKNLTDELLKHFKATGVANYEDIKQGGLYLMLEGISSINHHKDNASFSLIFSSHTFNKDKNSVISKVDELRLLLYNFNTNKKLLNSIESGFINNSLFAYRLKFSCEIYSKPEEELEILV
ncbi:hypothetical protein B6S12_10130 [Helicobacter valdiviensis]|uniref:Uncharacterized protein n=1 Tax=Helicobacter valdiviensis TaxID=1458358 RepID=A0A2W6PKN8_9HELI|nr:hypothetical protein [Helicobacter valdiviensis]PZT47233.1 hypothetical protein B6S12_10130 [Helicobacter valdiviensis]